MYTIREEITKWAINEGIIRSSKDWKYLSTKEVYMRYLFLIDTAADFYSTYH